MIHNTPTECTASRDYYQGEEDSWMTYQEFVDWWVSRSSCTSGFVFENFRFEQNDAMNKKMRKTRYEIDVWKRRNQ